VKGFSLRGLSAVSLGLGLGTLIAYLIGTSPLFRIGDPQTVYLFQLALFVFAPTSPPSSRSAARTSST